jgi:hypothetical protein
MDRKEAFKDSSNTPSSVNSVFSVYPPVLDPFCPPIGESAEVAEFDPSTAHEADLGMENTMEYEERMSRDTDWELEQAHAKEAQRKKDSQLYAVEFPKSALRGSMAELALLFGNGSEVPIEFIYMAGLTIFGLVTSSKLKIKEDGLSTRSNLYTVLLAPTGCKKSTAGEWVRDFFKGLGYLTDKTVDGNPSDTFKPPLVWPQAGSGEGVLKLLTKSPKLLLLLDELQGLLHKCRIENATLAPILTTLFDGTVAGNATKERADSVSEAHLGLIGSITTDAWEGVWSKGTERELGLLNRLFLVSGVPREKVFLPKRVDAEKLAALQLKVKRQIEGASPVGITKEGLTILEHFYKILDMSQEEATRLDTLSKKLSLILTATMEKDAIDAEVAKAAVELVEYQLKVRKKLAPSRAQTMYAVAEEKIRRTLENTKPKTYLPFSKLLENTRLDKLVGTKIVRDALDSLIRAEIVEAHPTTHKSYRLKRS